MGARVTIGDFSRASHLSVKTLRHYHEVGLLEPSEVDPGNGYRYYADDQIPVAQVIRRLRGLQMPVADVKSVLTAPDPEVRNRLIVAHLDRLEADLARTTTAVAELRDLLERPQPPRAVEHRTVQATAAIAIRGMIDREDVLAWWQGALGELNAILAAQGLQRAGPTGGMYESEIFQHGRGEATVFIPTDGAARAVGRVERLVVPPAELAIMLHRGSLANGDLTYGELGTHVTRHEISVEGPLREYYQVGFLDTDDPDQWETEIGWPIFRSDP
ncbi:MAG TPA: MerR family transcriptional regulator [Solirubrobacteraceae bacterium]|jgi:DNA-binding transcriptional MerR regulator